MLEAKGKIHTFHHQHDHMRHLGTALDVTPSVRHARRLAAQHRAHHQVLHIGQKDRRPIVRCVAQCRQIAHQLQPDLRYGSFGALARAERPPHCRIVERADDGRSWGGFNGGGWLAVVGFVRRHRGGVDGAFRSLVGRLVRDGGSAGGRAQRPLGQRIADGGGGGAGRRRDHWSGTRCHGTIATARLVAAVVGVRLAGGRFLATVAIVQLDDFGESGHLLLLLLEPGLLLGGQILHSAPDGAEQYC